MKKYLAALALSALALAGCGSSASEPAPAHGHGSLSVFQEDYVSEPHGNGSLSPFLEGYASLPEVGNPGLTEFYLDAHEPVEAELSVFEHLLNDYLPEGE